MSTPTLQLGFEDIHREVADFLGLGREDSQSANLGLTDKARIASIIRSAYHRILYPPPLAAYGRSHEWSWLRPVRQLVAFSEITGTISGTPEYDADTGLSTVNAQGSPFTPSVVCNQITFDTSGKSYWIAEYVNTATIKVYSDASGEQADDDFTIASSGDYGLPDHFGGLDGPITFGPGGGGQALYLVGEGMLRAERQNGPGSGRPRWAAVAPFSWSAVGHSGAEQRYQQRFYLMLWPKPDDSYQLTYRCKLVPNALDHNNPYPLGGPKISELLLEAALAVAEERMDDRAGSVHRNNFATLLAAAIEDDMRSMAPERLGWLADYSAGRWSVQPRSGGRLRINDVEV